MLMTNQFPIDLPPNIIIFVIKSQHIHVGSDGPDLQYIADGF